MANSMLIHAGSCRGLVFPDVTNLFTVKSPSLVISARGLSLGVLEIQYNSGSSKISLICSKCKEEIPPKNFAEEIMVECNICHKHKVAKECFTSRTVSVFCTDCKEAMAGKREAPPEIKTMLSYLQIPSESHTKPITEILKSNINLQ